jgi:hypothetical protein
MGENPIRSPQPVLQQQPAKEAALILHLGCPNVLPIMFCKGSLKLHTISWVDTIAQEMEYGCIVSCTWRTYVSKWTNWLTSSVDVMCQRPLIYFRSARADATDRFFRQVSLNRAGASSFGALPSTHLSCQKLVFLPSPSCITVQAGHLELCWWWLQSLPQFPLSVQCNQGHHRRSAHSRSTMPRPPNCLASHGCLK